MKYFRNLVNPNQIWIVIALFKCIEDLDYDIYYNIDLDYNYTFPAEQMAYQRLFCILSPIGINSNLISEAKSNHGCDLRPICFAV